MGKYEGREVRVEGGEMGFGDFERTRAYYVGGRGEGRNYGMLGLSGLGVCWGVGLGGCWGKDWG